MGRHTDGTLLLTWGHRPWPSETSTTGRHRAGRIVIPAQRSTEHEESTDDDRDRHDRRDPR